MCTPEPGPVFRRSLFGKHLSASSEDTGVSPRTVAKIKAERLCGPLAHPKKRPHDVKISSSRTVKNESFTVHAIRLKVHSMYAKREVPTLDSVRKAVNEDDDLPNFKKTTLWRLMKDVTAGDQGILKTGQVHHLPR
ncbi:hypothetical protein V5799_029684 [Amblyomma americanum]|uniref:Uncharacterized protein n=1 Tax=Amblyomma americanum TaxID=6943 RepID=A0AAQ4EQJ0_AMBAM